MLQEAAKNYYILPNDDFRNSVLQKPNFGGNLFYAAIYSTEQKLPASGPIEAQRSV